MAMTRGRPIVVAASTHPGEEEILTRSASDARRILSAAADRDRAAASRSRRGDRAHDRGLRPAMRPCARARNCRPRRPTSMSPTPWANSGLFYRLAPIVFMGGSLVEHGGQNPIEAIKLGASIVHGPHVFNFTDVYEALDAAGGARRADTQEALVKQLGQLLADPAAREAVARRLRARGRAARRRAGAHARGARALSAAVAARDGSRQCVSRASGTARLR